MAKKTTEVGTRDLPLKWEVFVTPGIPTVTSDLPPGTKQQMWSPTSSTLIYGKRDAVLVDAFITVEQADALVDWVAASGKNLTTIYATHGHGDHFFGIGALLDRFPNARARLPHTEKLATFSGTTRIGRRRSSHRNSTLDVGSCTGTSAGVCFADGHLHRSEAGYRLGSDRGSPNDGSTLFSKRVMAQIRSLERVRTNRPVPWRMPVEARR
jgi:hypothetical protein